MISFIAPFGTEAMAGVGVARNLEYLMFMPPAVYSSPELSTVHNR